MNKIYAIIIGACVGAISFFIAIPTIRKRKSHSEAMTFRELMRDNERSATNIWCETGGTK